MPRAAVATSLGYLQLELAAGVCWCQVAAAEGVFAATAAALLQILSCSLLTLRPPSYGCLTVLCTSA